MVSPVAIAAGISLGVAAVAVGAIRGRALAGRAAAALGAVLLGATPWIILLLRAQHDPLLNQGNPSDLEALISVMRRDQYAVAPLWPRRAPPWIQLANIFQYADWQFAMGVARRPEFSAARLLVSVLFAVLGVLGSLEHRARHRSSWLAMSILLVSGTLLAAVQLNLRAGPTIGVGVLPDDAPHEPRDRDYFFALGFWVWGGWAAMGGWRAAANAGNARKWAPLLVAFIPVVLNWKANDKRRSPDADLPRAFAAALLKPLQRSTVLFTAGDNDTYPLWYMQRAESFRPDVVVVTIPLLGADWYRAELHRRWDLSDPPETAPWTGTRDAIAMVARKARERGLPVAFDVSVPSNYREAAGTGWTLQGLTYLHTGGIGVVYDHRRLQQAAADVAPYVAAERPEEGIDYTPGYVRRLMKCPSLALSDSTGDGPPNLLATTCNLR
jgi:hypothetical protein